jgi:hypothetical protein
MKTKAKVPMNSAIAFFIESLITAHPRQRVLVLFTVQIRD